MEKKCQATEVWLEQKCEDCGHTNRDHQQGNGACERCHENKEGYCY